MINFSSHFNSYSTIAQKLETQNFPFQLTRIIKSHSPEKNHLSHSNFVFVSTSEVQAKNHPHWTIQSFPGVTSNISISQTERGAR
jgi:hypothetical protein